jgi:hypothetical protein
LNLETTVHYDSICKLYDDVKIIIHIGQMPHDF